MGFISLVENHRSPPVLILRVELTVIPGSGTCAESTRRALWLAWSTMFNSGENRRLRAHRTGESSANSETGDVGAAWFPNYQQRSDGLKDGWPLCATCSPL